MQKKNTYEVIDLFETYNFDIKILFIWDHMKKINLKFISRGWFWCRLWHGPSYKCTTSSTPKNCFSTWTPNLQVVRLLQNHSGCLMRMGEYLTCSWKKTKELLQIICVVVGLVSCFSTRWVTWYWSENQLVLLFGQLHSNFFLPNMSSSTNSKTEKFLE